MVDRYIRKEQEQGRIVELPPKVAEQLGVHVSPFSVIPKKSNPSKWRLIVDLSSPEGHSVNDGIPKELASLHYVTVDDVVTHIVQLGKGAVMAKMDVKHAYRNIPVQQADSRLLGMKWASKTLPFGLRSAPLIFSAVADALQWMMEMRGATWVRHYVDDFITVGSNVEECARNAEVMHKTCEEANLPVEPEKDGGPARIITFLGLQLDTVKMEVRLPQQKLEKVKELVANWKGRKAGRKRDLLSLIGLLTHAGKAIKPGRAYVR